MIGKELVIEDRTYKLESRLGAGAFGEVYLGIHHPTKSHIAVKVLPMNSHSLCDQTIRNEIGQLSRVKHPNVISVLQVNLDPNHELGLYLAMEYASEGTLHKKLEECRNTDQTLPLEHAADVMLQVAQGAKAINEFLIHRDIKPDNILFDGKNYKISDFGLAKVITENTRDHTFKGIQHLRYKAPEVWLGQESTFKLDVYSVGIVFYELLALKHPFELLLSDLNSDQEWEKVHLEKLCPNILEFRQDIDPKWADLLQRMVAKKPALRPNWDEVIKTIDGSAVLRPRSFNISGLVDAVSHARINADHEQSKKEEKERQNQRQRELIKLAFDEVDQKLDEVITDFNEQCACERFKISQSKDGWVRRRYEGPVARPYIWEIFPEIFLKAIPLTNTSETILAAGYVGPELPKQARSAITVPFESAYSGNLILVKKSALDVYGEWRFASIRVEWNNNKAGKFTVDLGLHTLDLFLRQTQNHGGAQLGIQQPQFEFHQDIQQAFADLLRNSIKFTDALKPKI